MSNDEDLELRRLHQHLATPYRHAPLFVLRPVVRGQTFDTRGLKQRWPHGIVRVSWKITLEQIILHTCGYDRFRLVGDVLAGMVRETLTRPSPWSTRNILRVVTFNPDGTPRHDPLAPAEDASCEDV